MPRGKKKLTLEEQLEKITVAIDETQTAINELKAEKVQIEEQIRQNQIASLSDFLTDKGLTVADIKTMLAEQPPAQD